MLKRLTTVLLFGGLLGLVPGAAQAAPARPAEVTQPGSEGSAGYNLFHHDDDSHYRCMYRCSNRERDHRYYRHRYHRQRYCWYHGRYGWYQARCRRNHHRY